MHKLAFRSSFRQTRRGLTLVELLVASTVMTIIVGGLAALAMTIEMGHEHSKGNGLATQHARVVIERIERSLNGASTSEEFPGFAAFSESLGGYEFPDTLVVWKPSGAPANPDGLPLFSEIVVYCPDPAVPEQLLEITTPSDTRVVPALSDTSAWDAELDAIRADTSANRVELTDLLRTASISATDRGCVRFNVVVRPSMDEWDDYEASTTAWEDLPWVQDIRGSQTGLRQTWCHFELQLMPGDGAADESALPFFGSAALYYELRK